MRGAVNAALAMLAVGLELSACGAPPRAEGVAPTVPAAVPVAAAAGSTLDQARGMLNQHDYVTAVSLLQQLAKQGDVHAEALLARLLGFGPKEVQNPSAALPWAQAAAQRGDAEGEEVLGYLYANGVGVAKNPATAADWLRRAAEQDNASAAQQLGMFYLTGSGVARDPVQGVKWLVRAGEQGHPVALAAIGEGFAKGDGLPEDPRQAFFWYSVALPRLADQPGPSTLTLRARDAVATKMTFDETRAFMIMAQTWVPAKGSLAGVTAQAGMKTTGPIPRDTGSGFTINDQGQVLTADHVVRECKTITVTAPAGSAVPAEVVVADEASDLAVLKPAAPAGPAAPLHDLTPVRQGETVLAAGYPLSNVLGAELNTTTGTITALSGWKRDRKGLLFSAPISPGNSGGPLLDVTGGVIGVVQAQLDNLALASVAGIVSQNVNFAVGGEAIRAFLDAHKIAYRQTAGSHAMSPVELSDQARRFTLLVSCQV